jgi:hypothetical protein
MTSIKEMFLKAPDGHLADNIKDTVKEWSDEPKAVEILKTLDYAIYFGAGSSFVVTTLKILFESSLKIENIKEIDVITIANNGWRKNFN